VGAQWGGAADNRSLMLERRRPIGERAKSFEWGANGLDWSRFEAGGAGRAMPGGGAAARSQPHTSGPLSTG